MSFQNDFVEVARLLCVETTQPKIIDDQEIRGEQAPPDLLGRVVGTRLVEELEELIGSQEEYGLARAAGRVTDRGGEEGLAHPDRTEEDHILLAVDEAQAEQVLHAIAIKLDVCIPVEGLQGLLLFKTRSSESQREALVIPSIDLVLQEQLEEVEFTELRLLRVGDSVGQRDQQARQPQPLQYRLERLRDLHGLDSPGVVDGVVTFASCG